MDEFKEVSFDERKDNLLNHTTDNESDDLKENDKDYRDKQNKPIDNNCNIIYYYYHYYFKHILCIMIICTLIGITYTFKSMIPLLLFTLVVVIWNSFSYIYIYIYNKFHFALDTLCRMVI